MVQLLHDGYFVTNEVERVLLLLGLLVEQFTVRKVRGAEASSRG